MILVIDGYNVLNELYRQKLVHENQFRSFVQKISNYVVKKGHQAVLVFDGYSAFDIHRTDYPQVVLYYAKTISADEYIQDYLYNYQTVELAVVSSDLEIYRYAMSLNIVTIQSAAFLALINQAAPDITSQTSAKGSSVKLKGPLHKSSTDENPELDLLMAESGNIPCYKLEESLPNTKSAPSKKLTKSEKRVLMIRKKL